MATCPHGCARCGAIEAGLGGQPLTPKQMMDVFGVVEQQPRERAPLAEDTQEAITATELAQIAYEDANREVGGFIRKNNPRDRGFEDALKTVAADCEDAMQALARARALRNSLMRRDQEAWRWERQQAEQRERQERREAEQAARKGTRWQRLAAFRGQR